MHPYKNLVLDPEVAVNSFRQELAVASLTFINSALENVWHFVVTATVGYVVYLMITLGTPVTPVAPTSRLTPEQLRDSFGWSTAVLASLVTLPLCYVDWRKLWRRIVQASM